MATDAEKIKKALSAGRDYDTRKRPTLDPHIDFAAVMITDLVDCLIAKEGAVSYSAAKLQVIETLLACHSYCMSDQTYSNKATGGASGTFHGQTGKYLEATKYGQQALLLDTAGCLPRGTPVIAEAWWGGLDTQDQTDYDDRNTR